MRMEFSFTFESVIRGHHVYKFVWTPFINDHFNLRGLYSLYSILVTVCRFAVNTETDFPVYIKQCCRHSLINNTARLGFFDIYLEHTFIQESYVSLLKVYLNTPLECIKYQTCGSVINTPKHLMGVIIHLQVLGYKKEYTHT